MSDTTFPTTPSLSHAGDAQLAAWGPLDEATGPEMIDRRPHPVEPR